MDKMAQNSAILPMCPCAHKTILFFRRTVMEKLSSCKVLRVDLMGLDYDLGFDICNMPCAAACECKGSACPALIDSGAMLV